MDNNEIISIKREDVLKAYKEARDDQKKLMELLFGKNTLKKKVTERIKTFEDACAEIGQNHPYVKAYKEWVKIELSHQEDIIAYLKLRIVTAALNEGWEPQFTQNEWRWFPWFCLWTDEELAGKSDEWKESRSLIDFDGFKGEWAGFAYAASNIAPSGTGASFGSRLCYQSKALAVYSGRQFADLWADFYLIRK